ncbi:ATP-grasp domain-containing protein [Nocardiopsis coralliicola]
MEAGYKVALLSPAPPLFSSAALSGIEIVDMSDRARAIEAALRLAERTNAQGVVTWSELYVELTAAIARKCGWPGPSPEAAHRARNKHAMRQAVADRPDLIPAFRIVRSLADLRSAYAAIGAPAVLKPAGAAGSKAILTVDAGCDLSELFATASRLTALERRDPYFGEYPGEFVYEERLGGSEHSVHGFVCRGRILIAGIADKWVTPEMFSEYQSVYPSGLGGPEQEAVRALTEAVVARVGLDNCAFHLDCRVLDDGTARMLEIGARPGGGYITSHLIPASTGVPFHANLVRVATGEEPHMAPTRSLYAGGRYVLATEPGVFRGFDGLNDVLGLPGLEQFTMEKQIGADVVLPPEEALSSLLGSAIVRAPDYGEVLDLMQTADDLARPRITGR